MSDAQSNKSNSIIMAIATTAGVGGIRVKNDNVSIKSQHHHHQKNIARK